MRDDEDSPVADAELERVLEEVPRGTFALVGAAMLLLLAGYFYVYLFVFLPRGMVG